MVNRLALKLAWIHYLYLNWIKDRNVLRPEKIGLVFLAGLMAALLHSDPRRLYSWWWDSHISPKNSKWLQENLTDMDLKVKSMIKLLEGDADSFARRAEMYYQKRPELMKLVEEFYRAYRALAERYDHAIVELRQAHQTMAEAFSNQIPFRMADDCPAGSSMMETDLHTPEMPHPIRSLFDLPDNLQKDDAGLSSHFHASKRGGVFAGDNDAAVTRKKGLKQLNEILAFEGTEHVAQGRIRKGLNFHEEKKKEDSEHVTCVRSRDHQELELVDKEDTDSKKRSLHDEVSRLLNENKELKAKVALECEHVQKAEAEVENLRQSLFKLQSEEEAACLQYQQCLERLSDLEAQFSHGQEEIGRLKDEILMGSMKLNGVEDRCVLLDGENQSLQAEVDNLVQKTKLQQEELTSKNKELEKLSICIHDENLHRVQAEEALQSLQHLRSQSQEENKALRLELQQWSQMLKDMELMKQGLEVEVKQITEEKLSSLVLIKNLQAEISSLKELKGKLEEEAGLSTHQKNALQQELCYLKEEKDDLSLRYQYVIEQVELVGLNVTCFSSSVKNLQDEHSKLKEICQKSNDEKVALLEKLEKMDKLSETNILLKRSLSDASAGLQGVRASLKQLEESYQCLQNENLKLKESFQKNNDEKVVLLGMLENMKKLSEDNMILERSLSDAISEIQGLRTTIKTLEESHLSLHDENEELKGICQTINNEKEVLLEKLENMEKLSEKNILLENSLSDSSAEEQRLRENLNTLEESFHSIHDENLKLKDICLKYGDEKLILSQKLDCMEKLSEKNMLLEFSLSDATAKLQGLEAKLKALEESFQSLQEEISNLVTVKEMLVSQVERCTQNMEVLSKRNFLLENSLSHMNAELEGLREKSNYLEGCHQSLQDEKSSALAERNNLLSEVESFRLCQEDLEQRRKELQNKHSDLERDRELTLHHVDEMQILLNLERKEHANSIQSSKTQHAGLEKQIHFLQEEAQQRKEDFEGEQVKVMNAQVEVFILKSCIQDIIEKNLSLSIECQKYVDASTQAKNMILGIQKENIWQQEKAESLLVQIDKLKMTIHQGLKMLDDFSVDNGCLDRIDDQVLLQHILERIEHMQNSILEAEDENKLLIFEKTINVILLEQLRLEICNLKTENYTLEREAEIRSWELSMLQAENHKILEESKWLILEEQASIHREEVQKNEMEKVHRQFSELQVAYKTVMDEKDKLLDENASLSKKFINLKEENHILQEENDDIFGEAMTQANLSLIFESIIAEKTVVLKSLNDDFKSLCGFNSNLENEIQEMVEKLRMIKAKNLRLKESVERLEEYKRHSVILTDELNMIRNANDWLNHQIEIGKNLLHHKEVTLLQVSQELEATQSQNAELHKEIGESRTLEEHLESELLNKTNEVELWERANTELLNKIEERTAHEEHLESELLKKINEVEILEKEVLAVNDDFYASVICGSIFKEKAMEIGAAYESLKEVTTIEKQRFDDERAMINSDVEELKREVSLLEGDNSGLKAEMAAYLPLIRSLEESKPSLEHHALSSTKDLANGNQEVQDSLAMAHHNDLSTQEPSEDHSVTAAVGILELQKLKAKFQAVEKVAIETVDVALQESSNMKGKLEVALEESKKRRSRVVLEDIESRKNAILLSEGRELGEDCELQRIDAEAFQSNHGLSVKDIQLDRVSDSLAQRKISFGMGRVQISESNDQMLELWETAEQEGNFGPVTWLPAAAAAANEDETEFYQIGVIEEHPSSELQAGKEMIGSNPEVSKKAKEPACVTIVDRLASDACRLANLQIRVQELKKKMDKSGKRSRSTAFDYDNMKVQLKEIKESISQLVDINRKLTKNAEGCSASDCKVGESAWDVGNVRKQEVVGQVQQSAEKIGRLELEVKGIQFALLKVEDQQQSRGIRAVDKRKTALLRDYLYGGISQGKRKVLFSACIRPAEKSE